MPIIITRDDLRYASLQQGHNARFPDTEADAAKRIFLCETPADTVDALQQIVSSGLRPTIRSGGHCYQDLVANNPGDSILDLSLFAGVNEGRNKLPYRIGPGVQLWNGYLELYKRYGVTLPGGTCGTVGAGGHISGGGYGLLSRLHGLSLRLANRGRDSDGQPERQGNSLPGRHPLLRRPLQRLPGSRRR
jgi:FAD/FMN-containing dehydrogenase